MLIAKTVDITGHVKNLAEKRFNHSDSQLLITLDTTSTLSSEMFVLQVEEKKKKKEVLKGSVLNQLNVTFVHGLHAHLPKPQKISG